MSSSNCCFLSCIQVSQEAGQVVWYSHLFQNFPQFVVIHTVKGFGIVNKAEIDVFFWNSLAFSMIQWMLTISSLVSLPFLKPDWTSGSSQFMYCWSLTSYLQEIYNFAEKTDIWTFPVLRTKRFRGPTLCVLSYLFPMLSTIRWQQSHLWTHQRKASFFDLGL